MHKMSSTSVPPKPKKPVLLSGSITKAASSSDDGVVAIVNAANSYLPTYGGVAAAIWDAAARSKKPSDKGYSNLGEEFSGEYGNRCDTGQAVITGSYGIEATNPQVKQIIHAVGPDWRKGGRKEQNEKLLKEAYLNALLNAQNAHNTKDKNGKQRSKIDTIVFPTLSAAIFAGTDEKPPPPDKVIAERRLASVRCAFEAMQEFYEKHKGTVNVKFICYPGDDDDLAKYYQFGLDNYEKLPDAWKNCPLLKHKSTIPLTKAEETKTERISPTSPVKAVGKKDDKKPPASSPGGPAGAPAAPLPAAKKPLASAPGAPPASAVKKEAHTPAPGSPPGGGPSSSAPAPQPAKPLAPQPAKMPAPQPEKTPAPQEESSITGFKQQPVKQQSVTEPTGPGTATLTPTDGAGHLDSPAKKEHFDKPQIDKLKELCEKNKWDFTGDVDKRTVIVKAGETEFQVTPNEVTFKKCKDYKAFAETLIALHGTKNLILYNTDPDERKKMLEAFKGYPNQIKMCNSKEEYEVALKAGPAKPAPDKAPSPDIERLEQENPPSPVDDKKKHGHGR